MTLLATSLALLVPVFPPAVQAQDRGCTRYAAPTGSDRADGSATRPLRSVDMLADSLEPGDVGCLRAGVYDGDLKITEGGTSDSRRVTIRSYAGEKATIAGRIVVARGADFVTIEELYLDGRNADNLPSPTVNASDVVFRRNDVTNYHTEICFLLGSAPGPGERGYGRAVRTLLELNTIHNCGRLPAENHDHGIYVEGSDHVRIVGNWIYDNADRGIQLYPDAQHTTITGNVIDGNGSGIIFSGAGGVASHDNAVEGNVISNSLLRFNVESYYPSGNPIGERNVVRRNCVFGGVRDARRGGVARQPGFTATGNLVADPGYHAPSERDLRLAADSPCRAVYSRTAVPGPSVAMAPPILPADPRPEPEPEPAPEGDSAPATGPVVSITTPDRHVRPGGVVRLVGRADTRRVRPGTRVRVVTRYAGRRWRTIAVRRVKARGRFFVKRRMRMRGGGLRAFRSLRRARSLRLRAVVPRVGGSRVVRLRVRSRSPRARARLRARRIAARRGKRRVSRGRRTSAGPRSRARGSLAAAARPARS